MTLLLGLFACVILVLWRAPDSPEGRVLHRHLLERPLELLAQVKRHHLIFVVIMLGFSIGGGEMLLLMGPELATGFAIDLSIYLDAVLVTYALSALAAARMSLRVMALPLPGMMRRMRPRRKRSVTSTPKRKPSNDDDPAPVLLAA